VAYEGRLVSKSTGVFVVSRVRARPIAKRREEGVGMKSSCRGDQRLVRNLATIAPSFHCIPHSHRLSASPTPWRSTGGRERCREASQRPPDSQAWPPPSDRTSFSFDEKRTFSVVISGVCGVSTLNGSILEQCLDHPLVQMRLP
jgi:hypothetical protein